ncbi:MAG: hypothetical protein EON58_13650 [Alphaproteobacteria bacterium]|nr:MAG: hypothetical protein EON58_13650 [Alphaproteobacteria bacterium]
MRGRSLQAAAWCSAAYGRGQSLAPLAGSRDLQKANVQIGCDNACSDGSTDIRFALSQRGRMATEEEKDAARPDIYIGLVCAAGTDLTEVRAQIKAQLAVVGYKGHDVKVSGLIKQLLALPTQPDEHARITSLMNGGDLIRSCSENGHGIAAAIIADIRQQREAAPAEPTAYIIDSLKNPAELALLDQVYGRNYYTVSVYLPRDARIEILKNRIAADKHQPPDDTHLQQAKALVKADEKGTGKRAQNVQETFPKADFFINGGDDIVTQVKRFIDLVFGSPFITPTADEHFMFIARATALRSADLSRQVGAVIVDRSQSIVSAGCNEVPSPGGGFYYEGHEGGNGDNRDYTLGYDPNYQEIQRTLIELIKVLQKTEHVSQEKAASDIADGLLHGQYKELMSNARIRNLIEFGRVVHAEMHALSQASAVGRSVLGTSLYCTTFPCHGCARHIIASGISDVIFIEPYPKSLTAHLYGGEIEMKTVAPTKDEADRPLSRVRFRPFHGVAPILYQRMFAAHPRKDPYGTIANWNPVEAVPVGAVFGVERPKMELAASNSLAAVLESARKDEPAGFEGGKDGGEQSASPDQKRPGAFRRIFSIGTSAS